MGIFLQNAWLIPLLPLVGFAAITLTPLRRRGAASAWLATGLMAASAAVALGVAAEVAQGLIVWQGGVTTRDALSARLAFEGFALVPPSITSTFAWAPAGDAAITMGYSIDPAVAAMLAMVAVVSTCIHLFSIGYMAHDARRARFFSFTSLFTAAMLLMVMASNLLLFFMAWEVMGLCSYLLIGFWHDRQYADPARITPRQAAIKAFITTRVGDVLLMLGLVALWLASGSLEIGVGEGQIFDQAFLERARAEVGPLGLSTATAIALLIFCGTIGKSAQVPLHVWLPDAMEGPTPVSALIHAATMVAAGVFLVARTYPIFLASDALPVVAAIGAITALFGALVAVGQFDIKRILAYSTISQLGFMVAALGLLGWTAALFHLLTHAFFKALLFLGAGSVIHGMEQAIGHGDPLRAQDVRSMGGLRRAMPLTFWTYAAGALALAGIPPLAGFWSKDEILAVALDHNALVFAALLLASLLTAFYMARQVLLVFFGAPRWREAAERSGDESGVRESPATMTAPLVALALFALLGGALNLPGSHWLSSLLGQEAHPFSPLAAALATVAALIGAGLGYWLYRAGLSDEGRDPLEARAPGAFGWLSRAFAIDTLYALTIGLAAQILAQAWLALDALIARLLGGLDRLTSFLGKLNFIVDDAVLNDGAEQVARGAVGGGDRARRIETGKIQDYLAILFAGAVVLGALLLYAGAG